MTEIGFYHLLRTPLETALPQLLTKALEQGKRAVVMAGSAERVGQLDDALWKWGDGSFLPHGAAKGASEEGWAAQQPVWLTETDENPNGADFLFLTDGATSAAVGGYARCFNLFNGNDDGAVAHARDQWKAWKDAGHDLAYWQQGERGWEKKA